jgi:RHS repeat-associated protein
VSLVEPDGTVLTPTAVDVPDASHLYATFDLSNRPTGNYTVQVANNGQTSPSLPPLAVVAGQPGHLQVTLTPPDTVYVGATGTMTLDYTNTGNVDMVAPLLDISASGGALIKLPSQSSYSSELQVLAISSDGPAGILRPGEHVQMILDFAAPSAGTATFSPTWLSDGTQAINWASVESNNKPSTMPANAWSAIWNNFTTNVGSTIGPLDATLAQDATSLGELGERVADPATLMAFEFYKADDSLAGPTLTGSTDLSESAAGAGSLDFSRVFLQTLDGRNQLGMLGYGWNSNWDMTATTDKQGDVLIQNGATVRIFTPGPYGYIAQADDTGILAPTAAGGHLLREADGTLYQFGKDGKLDSVQDPNGNVTNATYDANHNLIGLKNNSGDTFTLSYNGQGLLGQITDQAGNTHTYTYNAAMQLVSVQGPDGTTGYGYSTDPNPALSNALTSIANPDGSHVYFTYDTEGRLTGQSLDGGAEAVTYAYGPGGTVTETGANNAPSTLLFNEFGQIGATIDPLGRRSDFQYNGNGQLVSATLPNGLHYTYAYDTQGDLISETDPLGHQVQMSYDVQGNMLSFTDAKGDTTRYGYDGKGNLLAIAYADGSLNQYSYDAAGDLTRSVNGNGQALTTSYNAQGLPIKETFADGSTTTFSYDKNGNLIQATDATGTTAFQYDAANDLLQVTYPNGQFLKFSYNAAGQRTQSVDQTGYTTNYTYDNLGRLQKLTDGQGGLIVQYTYDATGNLIQKDLGNGTRTVYTCDAAGEVLSITNLAPDHTTVNSFDDYTYDAVGDVLSDTNADGKWTYTYDADSQLTHAVFTPNSVDPDGLTPQDLQYVYDAAGNRVSETVNGVTTTYVRNNLNEYTSSTTNGVTTTYHYDKDGNLTGQTVGGSTTTYAFNQLDQLTGVNGPGLTASYHYDVLGHQNSETINGVTTQFLIDPSGLGSIASTYTGSGSLIAHYTYGLGLTSQVGASGGAAYYDFNNVGSTIGLTNAAGKYVNQYSYSPFGETNTLSAGMANPFTFVGQFGVKDEGNGLFQMGARSYSPVAGRFISPDPSGLSGGDADLYRYANNQPTGAIDPTGLTTYNTPYGQWVTFSSPAAYTKATGKSITFNAAEGATTWKENGKNYTVFGSPTTEMDPAYFNHEYGHVIINNDPYFANWLADGDVNKALREMFAYYRGMRVRSLQCARITAFLLAA